jgi:uncharacterized membrane protein YdjX (TVP38/TMEM64 family)
MPTLAPPFAPQTKLLLMTLLRLSPIMPFTFSNYLTGLSSLPPVVIFAGTLLGTLPTQFVYVTAGAVSQWEHRRWKGRIRRCCGVCALPRHYCHSLPQARSGARRSRAA